MKSRQTIYLAVVAIASGLITSCSSVKHNQATLPASASQSQQAYVSQSEVAESNRPAKAQGSPEEADLITDPANTELDASTNATPAVLPKEKVYSKKTVAKPTLKEIAKLTKAAKAQQSKENQSTPKLTRQERKVLREKLQSQLKADDNTVLEVILAILIPPLGVYLHQDALDAKFWISLVLTLLFWVPGIIFALLVVLDVI